MTGFPRVAAVLLAASTGIAMLAATSPVAEAQRLGRLFTTPAERFTLDDIRTQALLAPPEPDPEPATPAPTAQARPQGPAISRLSINGIVRRSGGPGAVWVNGDLVEGDGITRDGVSVDSARAGSDGIRLRLPGGTGTVALRPGQQIDIESGTVLEAYEPRAREDGRSAFAREPAGPPAGAAPGGAPEADRAPAPGPGPQAGPFLPGAAAGVPASVLDDPAVRAAMERGVTVFPASPPAGGATR